MSVCDICVHKEACRAWVRHGETLYNDFEYDTDNCLNFTNNYDFVEVVRCKDCVHGKHKDEDGWHFCSYSGYDLNKGEHFCSYGERKDE